MSFSDNILYDYLRKIYNGFDVSNEIEPRMWREMLRILNDAAVKGIAQSGSNHNDEFFRAIRHSNEVFSAFKVHAMGVSMADKLLDENGRLKSFDRWLNDVQGITSHHIGSWLRTEYDTAVLRAHFAADWQEFIANKDILPNLRWMPTTSPDAEATHRVYWEKKLTLPVDHPFWAKHHPRDRWNCKCSLEATDEPATPDSVIDGIPDPKPHRGLENNPGKDGRLINDTHPYFPASCNQCAFYKPNLKNKVKHFFNVRKKDCFNCPYIDGCLDRIADNGFKLETKFKNGGKLYIHPDADKNKSDYKAIKRMALQFARKGHEVKITPRAHFKSEEYREIYGNLIGTRYERKCPDFEVNGKFYEYESYVRPWTKKKVGRMLSHGLEQSPYIVIDNNSGCSDRYLRKVIFDRVRQNANIQEVWVYEKGTIRLLYKRA